MARRKGFSDGISRTGNGKFKLRIVIRGRLIKRTFSDADEAERVRDNLRGREKLRSLGVPLAQHAAAVAPTLGSVLDAYTRECETLGRSVAHIRSIATARGYIVRWRGEAADADLRRTDLVDFVGWMKRETVSKGRAIHNALVILRTAFKLADLPVPPKPRLELPARHAKTLSGADVQKLLAALPLGSVARTAVEIGLRTAARESEIRRLLVQDVDLARLTLVLRRAKGKPGRRGSEEAVPIPEGLVRVLRAYLMTLPVGIEPEAPLLAVESYRRAHPDGRREKARHALSLSSLRRTLEDACERAGVPKKTTVGWCRAEQVTLAREAGMALKTVSGAAGHADERVTAKHYDESTRRDAERWEARKQVGAEMDNLLPFPAAEKDGFTLGTLAAENTPDSPQVENRK